LSRPISTVAPSLDGPVLEVLARTTRPLSGRQIHRLAGVGSEAGVRRVLSRLADTGLVHVLEAGSALLYALNPNHLAADAVMQLTHLRGIFFDGLRLEIGQWDIRPVHASLFGSTARGDSHADSDVDVLLIRPDEVAEDDPRWADQTALLSRNIMERTGNRAQLYDIDLAGLRDHIRADESLVADWRRDSLVLHGPEFSTVIRRFGDSGGGR